LTESLANRLSLVSMRRVSIVSATKST
jgi:hypothetical protein